MTTLSRCAAPAAALMLLHGCATLKIDVDVYKGPLTNDRRVQIEQVAVMAVGAQPLLIELRDKLEVQIVRRYPKGRQSLIDREWYRDAYVPPPDQSAPDAVRMSSPYYKGFVEESARRVNSILGLYQTIERESARSLIVRDAIRSAERLQNALGHLSGGPGLDRAAELLRPRPALSIELGPDALQTVEGYRGKLRDAYRDLFSATAGPDLTASVKIVAAHLDMAARVTMPVTDDGDSWPTLAVGIRQLGQNDNSKLGAIGRFELLADHNVASAHARLLVGDAGDGDASQLAQTIQGFATSYLEIRRATAELLELSLRYLIEVPPSSDPRLTQERDTARRAVSELLEPRLVAFASFDQDLSEEVRTVLGAVLSAARAAEQALRTSSSETVTAASRQTFEDEMLQALETAEIPVAASLLSMHRSFQRSFVPSEGAPPTAAHYSSLGASRDFSRAERRHGLTSGPNTGLGNAKGATAAQGLETWTSQIAPFLAAIAELGRRPGTDQGLGDARLETGLNELITEFLEQRHARPDDNALGALSTQRLLDELARFAEKLRFLAGFQHILEEKVDQSDDLRRLTDTLFAVSNSIMSQIDDLRLGERHGGDLERKDRRKALEDAIEGLQDRLRTTLEREGPKGGTVHKLEAALKAAYAQRSGLVRLRPAAAFLRNGYVTSGQQSNAEQGKEDEIDAQFWQSVNQIEVSSPGTTSYALVKDDVGNWYIKGFRSDPEAIIQSAKNLAMFAAKGSIDPTALARAQLLSNADTPDKLTEYEEGLPPPDRANAAVLSQQLEALRGRDERGRRLLITRLRQVPSAIREALLARARGADSPVTEERLTQALPAARVPEEDVTVSTAVGLVVEDCNAVLGILDPNHEVWSKLQTRPGADIESWRVPTWTQAQKSIHQVLHDRRDQIEGLQLGLEAIGALPQDNGND